MTTVTKVEIEKPVKIGSVELIRSGNLLSISQGKALAPVIDPYLSYNHKTFFNGMELYKRKRLKQMNPSAIGRPEFEIKSCRLYKHEGDKLYCSAGLTSKVMQFLKYLDIEHTFKDLRKLKLPPIDLMQLMDMPDFRYRQDEVIAMIDSSSGGVIAAPTGYGKSFLATVLCKVYPTANIAFVAPGLDLLDSLYARLSEVIPGRVGRIGGGKFEPENKILLSSADSLHRLPMDKLHLLIYDEVHTAATGKRSEMLCSQYTDAKMIGFSASVNSRADGADALIEAIFGPILLNISYGEAAEQGIVAKINTQFVEVGNGPFTPVLSGDTIQNKRQGYWTNQYRNQVIANECNKVSARLGLADPQILVMVETVEHLFELRRYLPDYEVVYAGMDDATREKLFLRGLISETEEMTDERRQWLLENFQTGTIRKVIANHCWKQGIDPIHLNAFVRADGGTSDINNIQLPGRLSRINKDKSEGLLIDFYDSFDEWALRRSKKRMAAYTKLAFNLLPRVSA